MTDAPLQHSLRPATADDALCLGVLAMQVFLDTYATDGIRPEIAREALGSYAPATYQRLLQAPEVAILVAERQGHLLGFAQLTLGARHPLVDSTAPAELDRLYVQEPFTGHGLGRALLHAAERESARRGASLLWLTPWVHNARARHFYAREGYADIGTTWFEFEGERHENRLLTRPLTPANAR
ncbi:GNAT family N-acetyltransferase [Pseudaquabacterium pictum]|uniref:N-acetyltransferase n=1 Tax=Pseudaquabacterium pictum TaxID=2315236 RepID=A0A480AUT4_9BURK|nr:GNAT family N-acetyltransferase [Rubrivivax pictus]GCL65304.1 N-acetyltransferase [Rubrivivax pictus]